MATRSGYVRAFLSHPAVGGLHNTNLETGWSTATVKLQFSPLSTKVVGHHTGGHY